MSSVSSERNGFSCPSLGRSDSVDPLFFRDLVGGRSCSCRRASSIWRSAIWPLSSSRRVFHSGIDLQSVCRASGVEKFAMVRAVCGSELMGRDKVEESLCGRQDPS